MHQPTRAGSTEDPGGLAGAIRESSRASLDDAGCRAHWVGDPTLDFREHAAGRASVVGSRCAVDADILGPAVPAITGAPADGAAAGADRASAVPPEPWSELAPPPADGWLAPPTVPVMSVSVVAVVVTTVGVGTGGVGGGRNEGTGGGGGSGGGGGTAGSGGSGGRLSCGRDA